MDECRAIESNLWSYNCGENTEFYKKKRVWASESSDVCNTRFITTNDCHCGVAEKTNVRMNRSGCSACSFVFKKIVRQSAVISSFCFALCYFSISYICLYFIEIVHKLNMFFLLSLFLIACVVCQQERGPSANADPYMFPGDDNIRVVSVATANEDYPSPGGTTSIIV